MAVNLLILSGGLAGVSANIITEYKTDLFCQNS
jgi:hypothetical protein